MCCFLPPHLTTYREFFLFFFAIVRVRIPLTILSSYSGAHSFVNTRPGRRNIFIRWQILSYPLQHRTVQTGRAGRRRPSTPRNGWDGIIVQLWGGFFILSYWLWLCWILAIPGSVLASSDETTFPYWNVHKAGGREHRTKIFTRRICVLPVPHRSTTRYELKCFFECFERCAALG